MMINIVDHSQELLATLKDSHAAEADKMAAFELLLSQKKGWWGDGPLMKFAKATALGYVRRKLTPHRLSTDLVDWEGLADESVMVLYRSAGTIHGDPRSWLVGVIHNLINADIRTQWNHLTGVPITEGIPDDRHSQEANPEGAHAGAPTEERRLLALDEQLISAIRRLTPALRIISELYFVHQVPRNELAASLGISDASARQRLHRAHQTLRQLMSEYASKR
jgi:RNA polymerase sigma factor (sigma-70 family)